MSQSCETLITKLNEWQKAILELERLSDEFLNTGNEKLKPEKEQYLGMKPRVSSIYKIEL